MSGNIINIGVVGTGKLGSYHIQKLQKNHCCNLIGVFDISKTSMSKCEEEYKVSTFDNLDSLLEKCDAVTIATPTMNHYEVGKQALDKGLHIFIEKPITNKIADAEKLSSLAQSNNKIIQVGHIERFNRAFTESLKYINKPQFIEIHRISPFPKRSLDIPVVMDLMIHDLDILLSMNLNNKIIDIKATGASVVTDFIDLANARIEFESGLVANLTASRISAKQMRKIRIFQAQSYLGIDLFEKKLDIYKINKDSNALIENKRMSFENNDALEDELMHFIDCIRNNKIPLVSDKDGIKALRLGSKIENLIN